MYAIKRGQDDLLFSTCWDGIKCLNQDTCHTVVNALDKRLREDEDSTLESDLDEQLLLCIPFFEAVKLYSIAIKGPKDEGPKTVKLYSNRDHMTFSDVDQYKPSEIINLSPKDLATGKPYVLQCAKFQTVRSLGIFVEDNQSGSDVTKIQKICLYGSIVDKDEIIISSCTWDFLATS